MEDYAHLFPKYRFITKCYLEEDEVLIKYKNFKKSYPCEINDIINNIDLYKFIHDNLKYFIEMLLSNNFKKINDFTYKRKKLTVTLHFESICVFTGTTLRNRDKFDDPETMFDDLRNKIGANIPFKPVISSYDV